MKRYFIYIIILLTGCNIEPEYSMDYFLKNNWNQALDDHKNIGNYCSRNWSFNNSSKPMVVTINFNCDDDELDEISKYEIEVKGDLLVLKYEYKGIDQTIPSELILINKSHALFYSELLREYLVFEIEKGNVPK